MVLACRPMIEELFSIGSFAISPFGVMLVASLFAAFWQLRKAMQHVDKAAGVLLVIAGAYIVYFWSIDLAEVQSGSAWREPVLLVERFSDGIRNRIRDAGGTRVGLVLGAIVAASIGAVLIRPRREPSRTEETTAV